jgi:hypothetical protein
MFRRRLVWLYDTRDTVAGCCRRGGERFRGAVLEWQRIRSWSFMEQTGDVVKPSAGLGAFGDEALGSLEL